METREAHGIWGGTTPEERSRARRKKEANAQRYRYGSAQANGGRAGLKQTVWSGLLAGVGAVAFVDETVFH
jgi:hypothetical protein